MKESELKKINANLEIVDAILWHRADKEAILAAQTTIFKLHEENRRLLNVMSVIAQIDNLADAKVLAEASFEASRN